MKYIIGLAVVTAVAALVWYVGLPMLFDYLTDYRF